MNCAARVWMATSAYVKSRLDGDQRLHEERLDGDEGLREERLDNAALDPPALAL